MADQIPQMDMSLVNQGSAPVPPMDMSLVNQPAAPAPQRGPLGEIVTGLKQGAEVGLPTLAGQIMKYVSNPGQATAPTNGIGSSIYNAGQGLVDSANARAASPDLTLNPSQHNAVTNTIASGMTVVAPTVAMLAAQAIPGFGEAADAVGLSAATAGGIGMGVGFGMQAGQDTIDKALSKGATPDTALAAGRESAAATAATQIALGHFAGQALGPMGASLRNMVGAQAAPLASDVLTQLTGSAGAVLPTLKALPTAIAEGVGLNAVQNSAQTEIENQNGIGDGTSPFQAALNSIPSGIGQAVAMAPFGVLSRMRANAGARATTGVLADAAAPEAARNQIADNYAAALAKPGTPEAQAAADAFRANAQTGIDNSLPLSVDSDMLTAGSVAAPAPPGPAPMPQAVTDIHSQVKDALTAAGVTPAPMPTKAEFAQTDAGKDLTGQALAKAYNDFAASPDTQEALMRADADQYETLRDQSNAGPQPTGTPTPDMVDDSQGSVANPVRPEDSVAPPAPFNTQLADSLQAALVQRDTDRAYAAADAQKAAETDAIANRTKGADLADAAAAGLVQPDANAPRPTADIASDGQNIDGLSTTAQAYKAFELRIKSLGIDTQPTAADQLSALDDAIADKTNGVTQGVRDRMRAVAEKWRADMPEGANPSGEAPASEAPVSAGTGPDETIQGTETPVGGATPEAGEPQPVATQGIPGVPPVDAAAPPDNLPAPGDLSGIPPVAPGATPAPNLDAPLHEQAAGAVTKMAQVASDLQARQAGGEDLTPREAQRLQDAQALQTNIAEAANSPNRSDEYVRDLLGYAKTAEQPYSAVTHDASGDLLLRRSASPEEVNPSILARPADGMKLTDVLGRLSTDGSTQATRDYATKLSALGMDTAIRRAAPDPQLPGVAGVFKPKENAISLFPGGVNEHTVLHEATHAATSARLYQAEKIGTPKNQDEARLKSAYNEIEAVRQTAAKGAPEGSHYGLQDAHEFVAELNSNPAFQDYLKGQGTGQKSLWHRAVDSVRKLLGMPVESRTLVERALAAQENFFSALHSDGEQQFNRSPASAGQRVDDVMSGMAKLADTLHMPDLAKVGRAVFNQAMRFKTVQFIADMARAVPEFRKFGLSQHVDAMYAAGEAKKVVSTRLGDKHAEFAKHLQGVLKKAGTADKQRALSEYMATIAGEAVRGGYDFKLNYADNAKTRPGLDAKNKQYIDDEHRKYTQLKQTNPTAAKALDDLGRLGRTTLIHKVATLSKNLIENAEGANRPLQAQLSRMSPADAEYAALAARVHNSNLENLLAAKHAAKLDIMSPDLKDTRIHDEGSPFYDQGAKMLDGRMRDMFTDARQLPEGSPLRGLIDTMEKTYYAESVNPYASLGRDGEFFTKVAFNKAKMTPERQAALNKAIQGSGKALGNLQDQDHAFFRFKTEEQARAVYNKMRDAGGDAIDRPNSGWNRLANRAAVSSVGVDNALRNVLESLHAGVDASGASPEQVEAMKASITRNVLSLLPETAAKSAKMERKGVPGYDADVIGNYARRSAGGVSETSSLYTNRAFTQATTGMAEAVKAMTYGGSEDGRLRAQTIADELNLRHRQSMMPVDNSIVNLINSMGHTFYLAASPGFLIRTAMQPFHRGLPALGARHGFTGAAKEIVRSVPVANKLVFNMMKMGTTDGKVDFKKMGINSLSAREQAFVQEMHDRGRLDLGQARQLASMDLAGSPKTTALVRGASTVAQYAEMTNRMSLGLAAFRMAERAKSPQSFEDNVNYAVKVVDRAMDNFDEANTARAIGKHGVVGQVTPLMTAFMNYNLQTMQQIVRTAQDGFFNKDTGTPEGLARSKEAKRELGGLMATTAMLSGALGLPFVNAFAGIYNMLTKDDDNPTHGDIRIAAQNHFSDMFGHGLGQVLAHGLPRLLGMDSSTFGLQDLLPGSEFLASRRLLKDRMTDQSTQLLGPALNGGLDVVNGMSKIVDGYYTQGIQAMLPAGLRAAFKAYNIADHGYTDGKGNPIPVKSTAGDVAWQALGFQPADRGTYAEAQSDYLANQDRLRDRSAIIKDRIYKASTSGTPEDKQEAFAEMAAFNAKNPTAPIRNLSDTFRQHAMQMAIGTASEVGLGSTGRQLPMLQQQYRFARPENAAMPVN